MLSPTKEVMNMADQILYCFRRYEKKYLITAAQQSELLRRLKPYMEPDEHPQSQIGNIYYDTPSFELIRTSLEKPVYKEKLRVRSYGVPTDSGTVFVEIKKKFEGVVYKRRISMAANAVPAFLAGNFYAGQSQIGREIAWFQSIHQTVPAAYIGYERLSFCGIRQPELRITFDTDIRWRKDDLDLRCGRKGVAILPENTVLMEIKIPGAAPLWLAELLSTVGAYPTSFSKYGYSYSHFILPEEPANKKEMLFIA